MANSEINTDGHASPIVRAFLSNGEEVTLNIERFTYKYSEAKDDKCTIDLQYEDASILDGPAFNEDTEWTITWGYIEGKQKTRKIYLREVTPEFTEDGVTVRIMATDKGSYLRERSEKRVNRDATLVDIANNIARDSGLKVIGLEPLYKNKAGDVYALVGGTKDLMSPIQDNVAIYTEGSTPATGDFSFLNRYLERELEFNGQVLAQDNARVEQFHIFAVHPEFIQGGKSELEVLKDAAIREKAGPVVVETRDDAIIIKKRNFSADPKRVFKWQLETRDVVSFTPESRSQSKKAQVTAVNVGTFDYENKTYVEGNITEGDDPQVRLGDSVPGSPRRVDITKRPGDEARPYGALGYSLNSDEENPDEPRLIRLEKARQLSGNKPSQIDIGTTDDNRIFITGAPYLNMEPGEDLVTTKYTKDKLGLDIYGIQATAGIDRTSVVLSPVGVIDMNKVQEAIDEDSAEEIKNRRAESALEMNPGSLVAEGDPDIECGEIITILGVGKRYSGNYYVVESEHNISNSGAYLITVSVSRNAKNKTESSDESSNIDVEKQTNAIIQKIRKDLQDAGLSEEDIEKALPVLKATSG
jgi:hypothetical protein